MPDENANQKVTEGGGSSHPPWPKPTKKQVIKAAISRPPSRVGDQVLYWWVKTTIEATKTLGFPIVIALLMVFWMFVQMPKWLDNSAKAAANAASTQMALVLERQEKNTEALNKLAVDVTALQQTADNLESASDTIRGIVIGKFKCPDLKCPKCPEPKCPQPQIVSKTPSPTQNIQKTFEQLKSVEIPMPGAPYSGQ